VCVCLFVCARVFLYVCVSVDYDLQSSVTCETCVPEELFCVFSRNFWKALE